MYDSSVEETEAASVCERVLSCFEGPTPSASGRLQTASSQRTEGAQQFTMLTHTTDHYDGVTIDEASLPSSVEEFKRVVASSLEEWKADGKKGVWLKVRVMMSGDPQGGTG